MMLRRTLFGVAMSVLGGPMRREVTEPIRQSDPEDETRSVDGNRGIGDVR
jgi:hypothetical protein